MPIAILGYGVVGGGVHALLRDGSLGMTVGRVLDRRVLPELADLDGDGADEPVALEQRFCWGSSSAWDERSRWNAR